MAALFPGSGFFIISPMTYKEKLLDPRWQKMRLEILNRDKFTCQKCLSTDKTLHVHHKSYWKHIHDPWDYPKHSLITLCSKCHEIEELIIIQKKILIDNLNAKFGTTPIFCLACGNRDYNNYRNFEYRCEICGWATDYKEFADFEKNVEEAMQNA